MKELDTFRKFLNENEVLDRYDKASKKLFDMTWDEVQRENDPRMKQDVHDEVQKDDDLDYIDDVQENQSSPQELNTFRKFLNENEDDGYDRASKELFDMTWDEVRRENDPRMRQAVHDEVQKDDDTNYIDDVQESRDKAIIMRQIRDAEEILDSGEADGMPLDNETEMLVRQELKRLKQMAGGDKKEKTMKFLKSKKSYRENLSLEEIYKDIMEVDEEEEKIRKKYDSMKRPSQDEVNDAFEKFNREAHYLNNKPVSKWDAADMSNWKSILSKGGKIK